MQVTIDGKEYVLKPEQPVGTTLVQALDVYFTFENEEIRVRDYLCRLLTTLWDEQEGFSGKRPFGNSAWGYDLHYPLAKHGFLDMGELDHEYGHCYQPTKEQCQTAHRYIYDLIKAMCYGVAGE